MRKGIVAGLLVAVAAVYTGCLSLAAQELDGPLYPQSEAMEIFPDTDKVDVDPDKAPGETQAWPNSETFDLGAAGLPGNETTQNIGNVVAGGLGVRRHYSIDDHLVLETVNRSIANGSRAVWEQAPPYDKIGQYGFGSGAWGRAGFQLFTTDLSVSEPKSKHLFTPKPGASYWLDAFSPTARYLSFYGADNGEFFVGIYDFAEQQVQVFAIAPQVDQYQQREFAWVSDNEFVIAAYTGNDQPGPSSRYVTGRRLHELQERAWSGGVSVTSVSIGPARSIQSDKGQLVRINAETGVTDVLRQGLYKSLTVSADGRYLAALRQSSKPQAADPSSAPTIWVSSKSTLEVIELNGQGRVHTVAAEKNVYPDTLAWDTTRNRLAFFSWDAGFHPRDGLFRSFDADEGLLHPYVHKGLDLASKRERGYRQKPERVMWVDGRLAVYARSHEGDDARFTFRDIQWRGEIGVSSKADWFLLDDKGISENLTASFEAVSPIPLYANARHIVVLADGDAWRIGPDTRNENLTASVAQPLSIPLATLSQRNHPDLGPEIVLEGPRLGDHLFILLDPASGSVTRISLPTPHASLLTSIVSERAALFSVKNENGLGLLMRYSSGREFLIEQLNEHMKTVERTFWTPITYEIDAASGIEEVEACLILPPGYDSDRRYPLIVEVYPNMGARCTHPTLAPLYEIAAGPSPYSPHLFASSGYIYFRPNLARRLIRTESGPISEMPSVVEQAVDVLVERGIADPGRVGILGFSQGAISALWVASKSDRFGAVVAMNGWADLYSHYFDTTYRQIFLPVSSSPFTGNAAAYETTAGSDFSVGTKPFTDPSVYIRNSPLFLAPQMNTPTLLIHSDLDTFSIAQYERYFTALNLQSKTARLLRYWGEGHGPSSPGNIRHLWKEMSDWYATHLDGEQDNAGADDYRSRSH